MKAMPPLKPVVVLLLASLSGMACGDNADGQTIDLSFAEEGTVSISWAAGNSVPERVTSFRTYQTRQEVLNPYDDFSDHLEPVGNVEIEFDVEGSNEAFEGPAFDDGTASDPRGFPVLFIDNRGAERTSPFVDKTDDSGRYVLGINTLVWGCVDYTVEVNARVMSDVATLTVDNAGALDASECGF